VPEALSWSREEDMIGGVCVVVGGEGNTIGGVVVVVVKRRWMLL
jgi:hypothetical protein